MAINDEWDKLTQLQLPLGMGSSHQRPSVGASSLESSWWWKTSSLVGRFLCSLASWALPVRSPPADTHMEDATSLYTTRFDGRWSFACTQPHRCQHEKEGLEVPPLVPFHHRLASPTSSYLFLAQCQYPPKAHVLHFWCRTTLTSTPYWRYYVGLACIQIHSHATAEDRSLRPHWWEKDLRWKK